MKRKRKTDALECSEKAMFFNRPSSPADCTGYSRQPDMTEDEAENLTELMNLSVKSKKNKVR